MGCSLGREIMGSGRGSQSFGCGVEFEATLSHTQGLFSQWTLWDIGHQTHVLLGQGKEDLPAVLSLLSPDHAFWVTTVQALPPIRAEKWLQSNPERLWVVLGQGWGDRTTLHLDWYSPARLSLPAPL